MTSIFRLEYSTPYVAKHLTTKTLTFDLLIRIKKVKFMIPSPKLHVLFSKYLISFLSFREDINGVGYFYVVGLGFYPGLIYGLKINYNEIHIKREHSYSRSYV